MTKNDAGVTMSTLRIYNGGDNLSTAFQNYLKEKRNETTVYCATFTSVALRSRMDESN